MNGEGVARGNWGARGGRDMGEDTGTEKGRVIGGMGWGGLGWGKGDWRQEDRMGSDDCGSGD